MVYIGPCEAASPGLAELFSLTAPEDMAVTFLKDENSVFARSPIWKIIGQLCVVQKRGNNVFKVFPSLWKPTLRSEDQGAGN